MTPNREKCGYRRAIGATAADAPACRLIRVGDANDSEDDLLLIANGTPAVRRRSPRDRLPSTHRNSRTFGAQEMKKPPMAAARSLGMGLDLLVPREAGWRKQITLPATRPETASRPLARTTCRTNSDWPNSDSLTGRWPPGRPTVDRRRRRPSGPFVRRRS